MGILHRNYCGCLKISSKNMFIKTLFVFNNYIILFDFFFISPSIALRTPSVAIMIIFSLLSSS